MITVSHGDQCLYCAVGDKPSTWRTSSEGPQTFFHIVCYPTQTAHVHCSNTPRLMRELEAQVRRGEGGTDGE